MEAWQRAEKFWEKKLGGKRVVGSGNKQGRPGDVRPTHNIKFNFDAPCLLESKSTRKDSISIKKEVLRKIQLESAQFGRVPLLGLTIGNERWLAIPDWALEISLEEEQ